MRGAWGRALVLAALGILSAGGLTAPASGEDRPDPWLELPNLYGMTGLVVTPTAYILPERSLRFGVEGVGEQWADHPRRAGFPQVQTDNYHYSLAIGFIPRVELAVRASYFPDDRLSTHLPGKGTVDRGASGRLQVLSETPRLPALAVGMDDVKGTRRFHSLYGVASKSVSTGSGLVRARVSAGYGSTVLHAKVHILDGAFGGAEVVVGGVAAAMVDYDTEKWNVGVRVAAFRRIGAQFSFLHVEGPAGGIFWTQPL